MEDISRWVQQIIRESFFQKLFYIFWTVSVNPSYVTSN